MKKITDRKQLIKAYIDFFKLKAHKEISNSSLIPEHDPTVLFTTAGMHPLVPFLLGQPHPQGKRLVNVQKCIRTGDIEEVGDAFHLTFFEMLGNWSLGDYWKKQAIEYSLEFLTKTLKIPKQKLSITCFKGDKDAQKDEESAKAWESIGIPKSKIKFLSKAENWWGPAGKTGPCGPCTEMFVNNFEIWNDVFMQYNKNKKGNYTELKQKNVDTGMGVERTLAILNNKSSVYETETFQPIIKKIEQLSRKNNLHKNKEARIIADHIKAACFILNEGILPGNLEKPYVLRKLIRRAIRFAKKLNISSIVPIAEPVFIIYPDYNLNKKLIKQELEKEQEKFLTTLEKGLRIFEKLKKGNTLSGANVFLLHQSYGFPSEITTDLAKEKNIKIINKKQYEKELKKHQTLSGAAIIEGRFKSGLADHSEQVTKLHTATHLLNQALRKIVDKNITQKGSNITPERLRFDFNFDRKLTEQEIKKVEQLVNEKIRQAIEVKRQEMTPEQAKSSGAQGVFGAKYGDKVSVYTIGNFSREICAGPHVKNIKELGKFKIKKEESSAAGIRRIKAVLK